MIEDTALEVLVTDELHNLKAFDVQTLDVRNISTITDTMIVASGTSDRHTRSIASHLVSKLKTMGVKAHIEGQQTGEWILVDVGDVLIHIMLPRVRDFYNLEKLWSMPNLKEASA